MTLGVVVGLVDEGRIARHLGLPVIAGGGTSAGAEIAVDNLIKEGVTGLLSFGLCGGLDPALRPGAVVVPRAVVAGRIWAADARLVALLGGVTADRLLGATEPIALAAEKRARWQATGAVAVDLESAAVARGASARRLPFAVLRAVCDPAERELPAAALAALISGGKISVTRLLASLLARPGQIGGLLRLAADARAAQRALRERVRILAARSALV